jgi:hypothetical protein
MTSPAPASTSSPPAWRRCIACHVTATGSVFLDVDGHRAIAWHCAVASHVLIARRAVGLP